MNFDDVKKAAEDVIGKVTGDSASDTEGAARATSEAKPASSQEQPTASGGLLDSVIRDEAKTDAALDAVADAAKKITGGRFDSEIDSARDAADAKLGES